MQYLPDQHRVETIDEYRARVLTDLTECKHQFTLHNLPVPKFFAYPFSAHEGDPGGTGMLWQMVTSLYRAAMLDDSEQIVTTSSNDMLHGLIQRMDITAEVTLDRFVGKIDAASPLDPPGAQPLADATRWADEKGRPAEIDTDGTTVKINPDPGEEVIRDYAPIRTSMWNDYTVTVDISGFPIPGDGTLAGISVLKPPGGVGDPGLVGHDGQFPRQADVTIDDDAYTISVRGLQTTGSQSIPEGAVHHVVIDVDPDRLTVTVDNEPPVVIDFPHSTPRTTGGGIALYAYRQSDSSPSLTFSNLAVS
jgi:hypothetical protein